MQQQAADIATNVGMVGLLAGVWANILPSLVSLVTLVWFAIKIYETQTVQKFFKKKKSK